MDESKRDKLRRMRLRDRLRRLGFEEDAVEGSEEGRTRLRRARKAL